MSLFVCVHISLNWDTCTLRLHYNADTIITRSPLGSEIFFQYNYVQKCQQAIAVLYNASCEIHTPCVFPRLSLIPVSLPLGGVNGSLNIQCLRNLGSCVMKRWLCNSCLSHVLHFTCTLLYMYLTLHVPYFTCTLLYMYLTLHVPYFICTLLYMYLTLYVP